MRYENFNAVATIVGEIRKWEARLHAVNNGCLGITINGYYYDDMVDSVRPVVSGIIDDKIDSLRRELAELGVV